MFKLLKKGQSTLEYAAILAIILGAFVATGTYFKRGIQGRWKAAVDDLGEQYDPRFANSFIEYRLTTTTDTSVFLEDDPSGPWTRREDITNSVETKRGFRAVAGAVD